MGMDVRAWMYGTGVDVRYGHGCIQGLPLRYVFMRHIVDGAIRMNSFIRTRAHSIGVYKHYIYRSLPKVLILNSSLSFPRFR